MTGGASGGATGVGQRSIAYQPALDGTRAVAVILVLLFHLDLGWMTGGYLGVSVFFTLSGFLITTLLVRELNDSGDIRLGRFYGRRARRLLPASLVCIVGAIVLIGANLVPDRSGLRWYILGALLQFANWVPLALRNTYAELFDALSPTDHFWSLAIEEQFYWLWPLTMLGIFRVIGGARRQSVDWLRRLLVVLGAAFLVFSISAPLTARLWTPDAAYFATWARIPEILAGAVLAVIVARGRLPDWTRHLAPVALATIVVASVMTPAGRGFAYQGGLPLFALVSAGLVAGVQHRSAVTTLLSARPLVFIGRISYGVYLYHWPVFVVLTPARTDLAVWPLTVLRLSVTFAIAVVSFFLIEQPVRERRVLTRPRLGLAGAGLAIPLVALLGFSQVGNSSSYEQTRTTLAAVDSVAPLVTAPASDTATTAASTSVAPVVAPVTSSTSAPTPDTAGTGATALAPSIGSAPTTVAAPTTTAAIQPSRAVRMLVVGDSTALATATGLSDWSADHPELAQVESQGFGGCGIVNEGDLLFKDEWVLASSGCATLFDITVPERIAAAQPDVVAVISSFWDVTDHRLPGEAATRSVLDDDWREHTLQRFTDYAQLLLDAGAPRVTFVLYPRTDYAWDLKDEPADDPERFRIFHDVERLAAARFPGRVSIIDLEAWSDAQGLTTDRDARPDGVHWTEGASTEIAEDWLGDQLIQAALH